MKFNALINNFISGLWSPKMISRADTEEYFKACTELKNMLPQLQGGAYRRPGSVFKTIPDPYKARLATGDFKRILPYRLANGTKFLIFLTDKVAGFTGSEWFYINLDTGAAGNLAAVINASTAIPDIETAHYVQVGDLLYITSKSTFPRVIMTLYGSSIPSMVDFSRVEDLIYNSVGGTTMHEAVPYGTINANNIAGTITVTGTFTAGSFVTLTTSVSMFTNDDGVGGGVRPGLMVKVSSAGQTGVFQIISITGTINAQVIQPLPGTSPMTYGAAAGTSFEIGMWSQARGWPRTIAAFEQRIYYGGTAKYPDTIWGSRLGSIWTMMEVPFQQDPTFTTFTTDNARPWQATIAVSAESYQIESMSSAKTLEIHTIRQDIVAYGGNGQAMGPINKVFQSSTSFGGAYVQPVRVNSASTYVQRGGKKLRDVVYNFDEDQYKSADLGFMADHLVQGTTIKRLCSMEFMQTSLLIALKADGKLMSCSIDRDYKMNAWSEWEFKTSYASHTIRDICVIPNDGPNGEDSLYLMVVKIKSGVPVVALEKLYIPFEGTTYDFYGTGDQMYYLDDITQAVNPSAPSASLVHAVGRLDGEIVSVVADGYYVGDFLVDGSGNVTLDKPAVKVMVGIKYTSRVVPNPIQAGAQFGTPVAQVKGAARMTINFFKTLACKYKVVGTSEWNQIQFRASSVNSNVQTPVFTGDQTVALPPMLTRKYQVEFETDSPFPMNINSAVLEGATFD